MITIDVNVIDFQKQSIMYNRSGIVCFIAVNKRKYLYELNCQFKLDLKPM